ncbi:MAG: DNA topoisomerase VI, partial [Nanoarchaeota archaeon]
MTKKSRSIENLKGLGLKVIKDIEKNKNPNIIVPIRALSNVVFNPKTRTLELGDKTSTRYFFNVAHAKKFLQTVEVASISKNLLEENKHASLRDIFYMAK